jgi:hypothetical protein
MMDGSDLSGSIRAPHSTGRVPPTQGRRRNLSRSRFPLQIAQESTEEPEKQAQPADSGRLDVTEERGGRIDVRI